MRCLFCTGVLLVIFNMRQSRTMTSFTINTEYNRSGIQLLGHLQGPPGYICLFDIRSMAFKTTAWDHPVKIRMLCRETGAIGPYLLTGKPGKWQFEKLIALPVAVCFCLF